VVAIFIYLFILVTQQIKVVIPKGYVAKATQAKERGSVVGPRPDDYNKGDPSPSTARCAQVPGAGVPPYKSEQKRKENENNL